MGRPKKEKVIARENPENVNNKTDKKPVKKTTKKNKPIKKNKKIISLKEVLQVVEEEIGDIFTGDIQESEVYTYNLTNDFEKNILNNANKIIQEDEEILKTIDDIPPTTENNKSNEGDSKIYVIDTSVILNDAENIYVLSQNNNNILIIPETVLDEIDNKKKGFNDINFQAREFNRMIDQSIVKNRDSFEYEGSTVCVITLELTNKTEIMLVSKNKYNIDIQNEMSSIINDRKILEVAQVIRGVNTEREKELVVVSNDIALRARALSLNLNTQPLLKNRLSDVDELNLIEIIDITADMKDKIESRDCTPEFFGKKFSNFTNVVFNCTDTGEHILAFYKNKKFHVLNEKYLRSFPVKPKNKEQLFFMNLLLDKDVPIVVCSGVTGSGKNLLSLVGGLHYINNVENNRQGSGIKYCRNTVTAGDEAAQLGFLKGDEAQKLSVFSYPLIDSIDNYIDIIQNNSKNSKSKIPLISSKQFMDENNISVLNINQMRGSNIHGYVILDEWQNSSIQTSKLMMTRINEGSKVVILGDLKQIDNAYLNKYNNGLTKMLKLATTDDLVAGIKLKRVQRGRIAEFAERVFND